jgi:hypothetical protein
MESVDGSAPTADKLYRRVSEMEQEIERLEKECAHYQAENERLKEFARWVMRRVWEGLDIDGGDAEAKALELEIIAGVNVTEPCGLNCACEEVGFPMTCYRLALLPN